MQNDDKIVLNEGLMNTKRIHDECRMSTTWIQDENKIKKHDDYKMNT